MKKIFMAIFTVVFLVPRLALALDCIKFENMAVKILKQERGKVYLSWKASVFNRCEKMITTEVQLQYVDETGKPLENSFKRLNTLVKNESRDIQGEQSLPTKTYYKIHTYYFKARESPDLVD